MEELDYLKIGLHSELLKDYEEGKTIFITLEELIKAWHHMEDGKASIVMLKIEEILKDRGYEYHEKTENWMKY